MDVDDVLPQKIIDFNQGVDRVARGGILLCQEYEVAYRH